MKTSTTNIRLWVSDLEEAILWLRDVYGDPSFAKEKCELKHMNPFTLVYLLSYMRYRKDEEALTRLKDFIFRVSNEEYVPTMTSDGKCKIEYGNPVNRFMREWKIVGTGTSQYVFAAMNDTEQAVNARSFSLMMIDRYVLEQPISKNGDMPPNWKKYFSSWKNAYGLKSSQSSVYELSDVTIR